MFVYRSRRTTKRHASVNIVYDSKPLRVYTSNRKEHNLNLFVCTGESEAEITNNKCIGDDTKAADRQSPNCIKKISAILDFRDPIMSSLKSPRTTSYRSSIETIALNCLVFEKIAFFCILATYRQTNRWTASMH